VLEFSAGFCRKYTALILVLWWFDGFDRAAEKREGKRRMYRNTAAGLRAASGPVLMA
jgi:hypothetical protein